jgi:hypothetical protein
MLRSTVALLCVVSTAASAAEPVVLWRPPPPAVGGMVTSVDPDTIRIGDDERSATWRMDWWRAVPPAAEGTGVWKNGDGRSVAFILVDVRIRCTDKTLMEDVTTYHYADGSTQQMPRNPNPQWQHGVGASELLVEYVCARTRE